MTETVAIGYSFESSRQELSNDYQHDRVYIVFKIFVFLFFGQIVASALEGLSLTHSCLEISMKSVIWTYGTFEDNFEISTKFEKYFKESSQLVSDE